MLKYMLEKINYYKVDPYPYLMGSNFHNGSNYKIYLFFPKKSLKFREILFRVHMLLNTKSQ